jgi:hypothetical protein
MEGFLYLEFFNVVAQNVRRSIGIGVIADIHVGGSSDGSRVVAVAGGPAATNFRR